VAERLHQPISPGDNPALYGCEAVPRSPLPQGWLTPLGPSDSEAVGDAATSAQITARGPPRDLSATFPILHQFGEHNIDYEASRLRDPRSLSLGPKQERAKRTFECGVDDPRWRATHRHDDLRDGRPVCGLTVAGESVARRPRLRAGGVGRCSPGRC
jgi:hypothetical protein